MGYLPVATKLQELTQNEKYQKIISLRKELKETEELIRGYTEDTQYILNSLIEVKYTNLAEIYDVLLDKKVEAAKLRSEIETLEETFKIVAVTL